MSVLENSFLWHCRGCWSSSDCGEVLLTSLLVVIVEKVKVKWKKHHQFIFGFLNVIWRKKDFTWSQLFLNYQKIKDFEKGFATSEVQKGVNEDKSKKHNPPNSCTCVLWKCCDRQHLASMSTSELDRTMHMQHVGKCRSLCFNKLYLETKVWFLGLYSTSKMH